MTSGIKTAIHIVLAFFAYAFAYQMVVWPTASWWVTPDALSVLGFAGLYAAFAAAFEFVFRTERSSWRYVSVPDAFILVRSTFLTAATFLLATFILVRADGVPRSVLLVAWLGHLGGLATLRMIRRLSHEQSLLRLFVPILHRPVIPSNRLLLVGNVGAADSFLRELARDHTPKYHPVGVLGLSRGDIGQVVRGVNVRGTIADLEDVVAAFHVKDQSLTSILFLSPPRRRPGRRSGSPGTSEDQRHRPAASPGRQRTRCHPGFPARSPARTQRRGASGPTGYQAAPRPHP